VYILLEILYPKVVEKAVICWIKNRVVTVCCTGDVRRPYPTEIDMRSSLLAKFTELAAGAGQLLPVTAGHPDLSRGHPSSVLGWCASLTLNISQVRRVVSDFGKCPDSAAL